MVMYTTKLGAGLGAIPETLTLLDIWRPGMKTTELEAVALESGAFPNVTARRLHNLVVECFSSRYLVSGDYPAFILKELKGRIPDDTLAQILLIFTTRANNVLYDFIREVYWGRYSSGYEIISNDDVSDFVIRANQEGKTTNPWADSMVKRVSSYLPGACADFGMLEKGRLRKRKILPFRIAPLTTAFLAYDLHFSGLGDNQVLSHPDWELFGLARPDVKEEIKQLSLRNLLIIQAAGDVVDIGWQFNDWKEFVDGLIK